MEAAMMAAEFRSIFGFEPMDRFQKLVLPYSRRNAAVWAEVVTGAKGKQRRIYRWYATPWEILRQLPDLAQYMKPELTVEVMNQKAASESDTASARRMQKEKQKLFATFGRRQTA